jgi:hypothetical protein
LEQKKSFKEKLSHFWERMKTKYGIKSDWHGIYVLFIFSIAGSTIVFVKRPLFELLGYNTLDGFGLKLLVYIFIMLPFVILPTYYVSLFLWSNILGQGKIFNPLIKKMLLGYTKLFKRRNK